MRATRSMLLGALALSFAACSGGAKESAAPQPAPPPVGQYGVVTFGQGAKDEGERLFGQECAFCHVGPRNTGTFMLERRLGKDKGELARRKDLDADYVKAVVRNGLVNMPAFSRVELTDAELDKVAAWLARKKK